MCLQRRPKYVKKAERLWRTACLKHKELLARAQIYAQHFRAIKYNLERRGNETYGLVDADTDVRPSNNSSRILHEDIRISCPFLYDCAVSSWTSLDSRCCLHYRRCHHHPNSLLVFFFGLYNHHLHQLPGMQVVSPYQIVQTRTRWAREIGSKSPMAAAGSESS